MAPKLFPIFITFLMHFNVLILVFVVPYIGLLYYEWKEKEYLMTFTASKKLNHLLEVQQLIF